MDPSERQKMGGPEGSARAPVGADRGGGEPVDRPGRARPLGALALGGSRAPSAPGRPEGVRPAEGAPGGESDRILLRGSTITVGLFSCPPGSPAWGSENRIESGPLVVYPWRAVEIRQAGRAAVVADPNAVMFYNAGQEYRRRLVDARGDRCVYLAAEPSALADLMSCYDEGWSGRAAEPFRGARGPGDVAGFVAQHRLARGLALGALGALEAEESAWRLVARAVERSSSAWSRCGRRRASTSAAHARAVESARAMIGERYADPLTLADVARAAHLSPPYLCRVFRERTGLSVHQHLMQIRLRASLELVSEGSMPLSAVAERVGFCGHAHFTGAFRRALGMTPSAFRGACRSARLEASRRLEC